MEGIYDVTGDERNGSAKDEGNEQGIEFYGNEIAAFSNDEKSVWEALE